MSIVGSVCEWNEFECGDDKYECVSELLACDGVKDCTNGGDEDPGFCDSESTSIDYFLTKLLLVSSVDSYNMDPKTG